LGIILEISQKVCQTQVINNKHALLNLIINAIAQLKEKENVTIIINPEMVEKLYAISDEIKEKIHNLENIKIIEDNAVSPDGAIVESVGSRIDARVSAQIQQFAQHLYNELNSTPEIDLVKEIDDTNK
jgi:flagellar biosynthesis/type III secretory pathway protein FliH